MNNLREITNAEGLGFDKMIEPQTGEKLLPVIVVDSLSLATDGLAAIRMQGYANREAVDMTFAKKQVTFYSRTTQGLWTKGEESGNVLSVRAVYTDCDSDCLLIDAEPNGPTCHTGSNSCFEVIPGAEEKSKVESFDPSGYLASLATIKGRFDRLQAGEKPLSYTEKLLADQNARVKKVGTEVVELVREECRPDFDRVRFIGEAADLVYATEVIVAARNINFEEVLAELARRNKK